MGHMIKQKHHGSCLCGSITYVVTAQPKEILNCHCRMCRKVSGSAYLTGAGVEPKNLEIQDQKSSLTAYQSSPDVVREFCGICGSTLFFKHAKDKLKWFYIGTVDNDDETLKPTSHIYVASKAPWHEIRDDLPQYEKGDAWYAETYGK